MTVELRPLGVKCNIQCHYCYQNPQRDADNVGGGYDLEKMFEALEAEDRPFTVFGGEPLLLPIKDLERVFAWGFERHGRNSVQTNGTILTGAHLALFHRYRVQIGLSIDGPGELNAVRWSGTADRTERMTERIHENIKRLCDEGLPPRLIVTLHRDNATADKLPRMYDWMRRMESWGVRSVRLHILEVETSAIRDRYALSDEENVAAFLGFAALERELDSLGFDVFEDMRRMLRGQDDGTTCIWNACDPLTTPAVRGVEGQGQRSNCGRTNKDGIDFVKASSAGFERYLALYHTPQSSGGCQGCRFFLMCKGHCPGTAEGGDWRRRSEHCGVWMRLYEVVEEDLASSGEVPLSRRDDREDLEGYLLSGWMAGRPTSIGSGLEWLASRACPATAPSLRTDRSAPGDLDFRLPPFTRVSWVSEAARGVWAPRIAAMRASRPYVAVQAVADGVSACAVLPPHAVREAALVDAIQRAGLARDQLIEGEARWVVGRTPDVEAFLEATRAGETDAVAGFLGHPDCCHAALEQRWVEDGQADATWPTARASSAARGDVAGAHPDPIELACDPRSNMFWRPLGLAPVFHQPCTDQCAATLAVAEALARSAVEAGFGDAQAMLEELLSWPVAWSSLHGIAELKTPILRLVTHTDASSHTRIVRRWGNGYPAEGATGLRFPYQMPGAACSDA